MNLFLKELVSIVGIYSIIHYIIFCIFLWFIFKKENIKCFFSIIPFVNYYYYFKICKIPFSLFFIPVINILVIIFMTYRIAHQYGFKRILCTLSIFFPLIFLGIIAFSKRKNIDIKINTVYIKNTKDVDKLEDHLLKEINNDDYNNKLKIRITNEKNKMKDDFIDSIEQKINNDEYVYEEKGTSKTVDLLNVENQDANNSEANEEDYVLSMDRIDNIEKNVMNNYEVDKTINKDLVEYKQKDVSDREIAFGGKEEVDIVSKAKVDELVCKRCGSSLVGAIGYCPGCNAKI